MPAAWVDGDKDGRDMPRAEEPGMDPMGDGDGKDDLLLDFDYRRSDRDSAFDGLRQRLDLVAVMITVIIAGATGYVGINIMQSTLDSSTTVNTTQAEVDPANATGFENSSLDLTQGLESFFNQLGTVFVVIVLVVIIGYLMLLRGR